MSSPDQQGSVSKRRATLLGAALLAGAVLLWLSLHSAAVPEVVAASTIPVPSEDPIPRSSAADPATAAVARAPPSFDGFNVSVHLQYDSTDALVLSKVREYYDALINGLRAVPRLHLVDNHALLSSGGPEEFRLIVSSLDLVNAQHLRSTYSEWGAIVSVEVLTGEAAGTMYGLGMIGDAWKGAPKHIVTQGPLSGQCAARPLMPCTPGDIAERHVMALRKHVFPRDGSLQRELEARFLDEAQPETERQRLRNELKSMDMNFSDAMIREAVARLTRPMDSSNAYAESERYDLLIILAGQRHKGIVQPLIDLAMHDPDVAFRIEALRLLAKDYPENSAVQVALKNIALDPSNPLQNMAVEMLGRSSGN